MTRIWNFLNNRPLCFLGSVFSLRDLVLGLGLIIAPADLSHSLLYHNLQDLGGAWIYGAVFVLISVATMATAIADRVDWVRRGLEVQAWFWLFACVTYLVNGDFTLALFFGLGCSIPSGYLSHYYKNVQVRTKHRWRMSHGLPPLDA